MNTRARLFLCAACAIIGAIEAPRAMHVLGEDLAGPYEHLDPASTVRPTPAVLAWTDPALEDADADDIDGVLFARGEER
jgi:hypothetical protein